MKPIRMIIAMTAALGLSACASVETATRNAPIQAAPVLNAPVEAGAMMTAPIEAYNVTGFDVHVPRELKVSEANTFKPRADIVWREDPMGDRYIQIETLARDGLQPLLGSNPEGRAVVVDVQFTRFHALTQKTRYTVGGTHDIHFFLTVEDAQTGQVLQAPRLIETEFKAYGGAQALEAMSRGETQKLRIQRHLRQLISQELHLNSAAPAAAPVAPAEPMHLSALSSRGI